MSRRRWVAVVLVIAAVAWSRLDALFEGPELIPLGPNHGIVTADLVGIAFVIVAVVLWGTPS
jgi:hypothetical protein